MPDYKQGKIYKITAKNADDGDVYIGSTCQKLYKRMCQQRENYLGRKSYTSRILFDKYGYDNCYIELIKDFPCETKQELWDEETKYIKGLKCVNRFIPNRNKKQYVLDTKEHKRDYDKNHLYEKQQRRFKNRYACECGKTLNKEGKVRHEISKAHLAFITQHQ